MGGPAGCPRRGPELVEAVVQVGSRVTEYVRAGRGRTVLLISEGGRCPLPPDPLLETLARSFRVIAATVPDGEDPFSWLRGLVEGLGMERPHVVVRGRGEWVEEGRRQLDGEVDRVVVMDEGGPPWDEVAGLLSRDH